MKLKIGYIKLKIELIRAVLSDSIARLEFIEAKGSKRFPILRFKEQHRKFILNLLDEIEPLTEIDLFTQKINTTLFLAERCIILDDDISTAKYYIDELERDLERYILTI